MAIIPLKQTVTVQKFMPAQDRWNEDRFDTPITYKVRASERFQTVVNSVGEEVVSSVKLTFDKMPDITLQDLVTYTNEAGVKIERQPINIKPVRMINGKPTLTSVYL